MCLSCLTTTPHLYTCMMEMQKDQPNITAGTHITSVYTLLQQFPTMLPQNTGGPRAGKRCFSTENYDDNLLRTCRKIKI